MGENTKLFWTTKFDNEKEKTYVSMNNILGTFGSGVLVDIGNNKTRVYFVHDNELEKSVVLHLGGYTVLGYLEILMRHEKRMVNGSRLQASRLTMHYIRDNECSLSTDFEKTMNVKNEVLSQF